MFGQAVNFRIADHSEVATRTPNTLMRMIVLRSAPKRNLAAMAFVTQWLFRVNRCYLNRRTIPAPSRRLFWILVRPLQLGAKPVSIQATQGEARVMPPPTRTARPLVPLFTPMGWGRRYHIHSPHQ
jgi:hypothetical protein